VTITTEKKLKDTPGAIARSRHFIDYRLVDFVVDSAPVFRIDTPVTNDGADS
jgi:hypothetical protein